MNVEKKWYVVYSKPRWEKKLYQLFQQKNITAYCPINRVLRRWSDRMKMVEIPLFTSYVFVKISEKEKLQVRETDGVVNFVYEGGSPAIVREYEINRIKKFLDEYDNVEVTTEKIEKNQRVQVNRGLFVEKEGTVLDLQNKKAKVAIESIGYTLVALFDQQKLRTKNYNVL